MAYTGSWVKRSFRTYYDNPTAVRDFRAQLRGSKALLLWGGYLLLLTALTLLMYGSVASLRDAPIAGVQRSLRDFYQQIVALLATTVCVITPALTAGTIGVERQRRSLDLLFSAPVSMKGLLVGKMISSYRYIWMLLVLSLPLTSVCVVMGGASWSDVLITYALISFAGIVLTAIGLVISCLTNSIGAAILWTYLAVIFYLMSTASLSATAVFTFGASDPLEQPWYVGINPFFAAQAAPTHWTILSVAVPNWIFAGIFALIISKFLLVGAGSSLSPFGTVETKSLRIHSMVYLLVLTCLSGYAVMRVSLGIGSGMPVDRWLGMFMALGAMASVFVLPYLACYNSDSGRKYINDGRWSFKKMWYGTPAGNLPFLVCCWGITVFGLWAGRCVAVVLASGTVLPAGTAPDPLIPSVDFFSAALWCLGYLFMWWAIGRTLSSRAGSLKTARVYWIVAMIVIVGLPIPLLSIAWALMRDASDNYVSGPPPLFALHLMYPVIAMSEMATAGLYGLIMGGIGVAALGTEKQLPRRQKSALNA